MWDEIKYSYNCWRYGGSDDFLLWIILLACLLALILPALIYGL